MAHAEQERLRSELARLGLQVRREAEHTDQDERDARKVVHPSITGRVAAAHTLLGRYANEQGWVSSTAVEGVAKLAGLTPAETSSLQAAARPDPRKTASQVSVHAAPLPAELEAQPREVAAELEWADFDPDQDPEQRAPAQPLGDIGRAVEAARAVLNEDRFTRRPAKRRLTAEEEVGLGVLVRGGPDRIETRPTDAEIAALPATDLRVMARNCLVMHNQGLAHAVALRHLGQGLDHDDLFQHGALGLLKAAVKFDPARGYKFSTYATWWIRQSISRAIADEGAVIRIPVHFHEQVRKVAAVERRLQSEGRPSSAAHVAVACDLSVGRVEEIRKVSRRTDSLDRVIGDGVHLGDLVALDRPLPSAEHLAIEAVGHAHLLSLLTRFDARDARILLRRTGLDGGEKSTLDELGKEFGVTRERIRQVEGKAFGAFRQMLQAEGIGLRPPEPPDPKPRKRKAPLKRSPRLRKPVGVPAQRAPLSPQPTPEHDAPALAEGCVPEAVDLAAQPPLFDAAVFLPTKPGTEPIIEPEPESSTGSDLKGAETPSPGRFQPDWEQALAIPVMFAGGVAWLAEYALIALGDAELAVLLGQSATEDVVGAVQRRGTLDRPVVTALQVLQKVFNSLKNTGQRPADFLDRSFAALNGASPRTYLAERPLVRSESRLALRDALEEFTSQQPVRGGPTAVPKPAETAADPAASTPAVPAVVEEPAMQRESMEETETVADPAEVNEAVEPAGSPEAVAGLGPVVPVAPPAKDGTAERRRPEAAAAERRLREEHADALEGERQRTRRAVADAERQLDELESVLLKRVDLALQRQAASLHHAADERVARLRMQAEVELQAARQAAEPAAGVLRDLEAAQRRADEAEELLRRAVQEHEARVSALAARLQLAESALAQRERALEDADEHATARVEAVERWAAQRVAEAESEANGRVAQAEHDAWVRIAELQNQLSAMTDSEHRPLRDGWRRG
ncbi:sigma-70 family RNA polymerase sigma factor [Streptomyces sp. NBC_00320]|uniref:sigma-70 family RNA polymerase sigma factor n=1 Tax=Streptomyces sp. NBC_00320 TaxID=2975711 RepID=UPI0022543F24|nr:sigma-70 family RNA polymerase sigma factor [Streptomyces sp. NBC_00320]MCX5150083.1 sigma-70 family RNA polymerase sigma factor [Streptomyces sp. NBC_00320]